MCLFCSGESSEKVTGEFIETRCMETNLWWRNKRCLHCHFPFPTLYEVFTITGFTVQIFLGKGVMTRSKCVRLREFLLLLTHVVSTFEMQHVTFQRMQLKPSYIWQTWFRLEKPTIVPAIAGSLNHWITNPIASMYGMFYLHSPYFTINTNQMQVKYTSPMDGMGTICITNHSIIALPIMNYQYQSGSLDCQSTDKPLYFHATTLIMIESKNLAVFSPTLS